MKRGVKTIQTKKKNQSGSTAARPVKRRKSAKTTSPIRATKTKTVKRQSESVQNTDRHVVHATSAKAEELRKHLIQYMDSSGYVSWSAKRRQYMILGTSSTKEGLAPCPSCGVGQLLVIKSPTSGKRFMGCTNFYGGCDASSPLLQKARLRGTKKTCKVCRWPEVIFRYSSKQKWTRQCSNIACPTRSGAQ